MPTTNVYLRHIFQGGWSTDTGPTTDVQPQGTLVPITHLVTAENVFYELDGGPHKIQGTSKLNSVTVESGEQIRGLFDYWKQGTAGTPVQKRVIHAGTKVLKDDADGTFDDLFTGLEDDTVPSYATFDDILIITSNSNTDVPKSWDQITAQDLAGSPPNFAFSVTHKNRHWAAGVAANPSRLYYSALLDPEDWTGAGSGSIDIDPGDGDKITALETHKNELWVFKGPYKGSIHRITGSAPTGADPFARTTFIDGLGAVAHNSTFGFRDDLGFMWSDGTIHSLNSTAAFGDFNQTALSRDIDTYVRDHFNNNRLQYGWAATDVSRGIVLFTMPVDSSTDNNAILMMDYRFNPVRWAKWTAYTAGSLASVIDSANGNQRVLMIGANDGFVRRTNAPTRSVDGITAISYDVKTPFFTYGTPIQLKTVAGGSVGIAPKGNFDTVFGWQRDGNAQQAHTFQQAGGDVLAPASANQFTLGTSTLGGGGFVDVFFDLPEGGEGRAIQYQLTNSGNNEDLEVHSVSAILKGGTWSLEN